MTIKNRLTKIFPLVFGGTLLSGFLGMNFSSQEIAAWYTNAITGIIIGTLFAILYHISISSPIRATAKSIIVVFLGAFAGAGLGLLVGVNIGAILVESTKSIVSLIGETTTSILFGMILWTLLSAITEIENPRTIPTAKVIFSFGTLLGWLGGWIGTVSLNLIGKTGDEMEFILAVVGAIIGLCGSAIIVSQMNKENTSSNITAG